MESSEQKGGYNSSPICTKKRLIFGKGGFYLVLSEYAIQSYIFTNFNFCDITLLFSIRLGICCYIWPWLSWSTTVFCKLSVWTIKYCLEFSIPRWPFLSCNIFKAYLLNSLRFSEVLNYFSHFTSLVRLFFVKIKKGNLKFSGSKMWWREESGKFSLS